jgi:hypothetical protein
MVIGVSKEWTLKQGHPAARTLILQVTGFDIDESNKPWAPSAAPR